MKRTLVLIRHAKSSWAEALQADFDRPLNERGKEDAPEMGKRLKKMGIVPDLIVASKAKRAAQTAKHIAKELHYETDNIKWVEKLYHCSPSVFEEVIGELDKDVKTVFIVAHNPGITQFANELSHDFSIDNMPTCGVVGAHVHLDKWEEFETAKKQVFLFEYPKKHDHTE